MRSTFFNNNPWPEISLKYLVNKSEISNGNIFQTLILHTAPVPKCPQALYKKISHMSYYIILYERLHEVVRTSRLILHPPLHAYNDTLLHVNFYIIDSDSHVKFL
jgi:hypothetical protein